ncbi:hypothetical protein GCM10023116_48330 [Kistimonas scapharcae]|uniref:Uncharacterized protein n=1 Tax=Kistimonas scapharcae TaxID=1036133 RepID=A0ABP8VAJ9_9GAMM
MGKKSGNDYTPPPAPEEKYATQIGHFSRQENQRREQEANAWNDSVSAFNNQLQGFADQGNDFLSQARGLSFADQDAINTLRTDVYSTQDQFNALNWTGGNEPLFQSSQYGFTLGNNYYGANVGGLATPDTLDAPDLAQRSSYGNAFSGTLDILNSLDSQYSQEQQRYQGFQANQRTLADQYNQTFNTLGIANDTAMNTLERNIQNALADNQGFTSELNTDFSRSTGLFNDTLAGIADLRSQREAEQQRINDFQTRMNTLAGTYGQTLDGLDITHADGIINLNSDIESTLANVRGFSSELSPDLSAQLEALSGLDNRVDSLQLERNLELRRIADAEANARNQSIQIADLANASGIYNQANLDSAYERLAQQQSALSDFNSVLDYDFSDENSLLTSTQGILDSLTNQRTNTVDNLFNSATELGQSIQSAQDWDEAALRELKAQALAGQTSANNFMGGRAGDLQTAYGDTVSSINDRLQALFDTRSTIESDAQAFQGTLDDTTITSLDQLKILEDQFSGINSQYGQYNAAQAQDEVDAISQLLSGERTRLEADAEAAARAELAGQVEVSNALDQFGNLTLTGLPFRDPLTVLEYKAWLEKNGNEEDADNPAMISAFARALGLNS